jgi:hypothetical protein
MILGVLWWKVLIGFFVMHYTAGLILSIVFQLAHVIEDASIITYKEPGSIKKQLVTKDGDVVATIALNQGSTGATSLYPSAAGENILVIGHTGMHHDFHPFAIGGKYGKYSTYEEAESALLERIIGTENPGYSVSDRKSIAEELMKVKSEKDYSDIEELLYEKRLETFPENVRDKAFVKSQARLEAKSEIDKFKVAKENAKAKIKQLKINNENRFGDALYRGVSAGSRDLRGRVGTGRHFAATELPNPISGELERAYRAERYWNAKYKKLHPKTGIPQIEDAGGYSILNWKLGGKTPKLRKFIY